MKGNFNTLIKDKKPVLVDFFAEWCGPCKAQAPILKELAKITSDIRIIKIDIDKNPSIAQRFNVRSVPSLMLFKDVYTIWRQTGVVSLQQLKELVS